MGVPPSDFEAKVLGMIQCNAGPALHIEIDPQLDTVLIYRDVTEEDRQLEDIPYDYARRLLVEMDRDLFDSLSVHDILKKAGVPRK